MTRRARPSTTDGSEFDWRLEPHACRICFGRIVSRRQVDGPRLYRCANCGTEVLGGRPSALCCCGMKLATGRDAGVRCVRNPKRTTELTSEIIVEAASVPKGAPGAHGGDMDDDDAP